MMSHNLIINIIISLTQRSPPRRALRARLDALPEPLQPELPLSSKNSISSYAIPVSRRRIGKCVAALSLDSGGVRPIWRFPSNPAGHPIENASLARAASDAHRERRVRARRRGDAHARVLPRVEALQRAHRARVDADDDVGAASRADDALEAAVAELADDLFRGRVHEMSQRVHLFVPEARVEVEDREPRVGIAWGGRRRRRLGEGGGGGGGGRAGRAHRDRWTTTTSTRGAASRGGFGVARRAARDDVRDARRADAERERGGHERPRPGAMWTRCRVRGRDPARPTMTDTFPQPATEPAAFRATEKLGFFFTHPFLSKRARRAFQLYEGTS
eukprot:13153-Pelagococcus_subviridis.AAC.2